MPLTGWMIQHQRDYNPRSPYYNTPLGERTSRVYEPFDCKIEGRDLFYGFIRSGSVSGVYHNWSQSTLSMYEFEGTSCDIIIDYGGYVTSLLSNTGSVATEIKLKSVNFPNVTYIDPGAMRNCYSLSSVVMPKVEYIGGSAFYECHSLSSIDFPMLSYIGVGAFNGCYKMSMANIERVKIIENSAFRCCSALRSISIPFATSIGERAFYKCYKLESVILPMVSSIGMEAFYWCGSISSISLPDVEYVGFGAFSGCSKIGSVVELPRCTFISDYAFCMCDGITEFTLPNVSYIGGAAFMWDDYLSRINLLSDSVCQLKYSNVFENTSITSSTGSIIVPLSLINAYKTAENWSYFSDRIFGI